MTETYIHRTHAEFFKGFDEIDIEFNKRFNFITGPNGSGKTSVLSSVIASCSNQFLFRTNNNTQFWIDTYISGASYRIGFGSGGFREINFMTSGLSHWRDPPGDNIFSQLCFNRIKEKIPDFNPPLAIGAYRRITYKKMEGMKREADVETQKRAYLESGMNNLLGDNMPDPKQWLINRYFIIEKDYAVEEKQNWHNFLANLPHLAPAECDFKFIKIERELEPVFSIYGRECYLEELSAGFQSVLSLVINIINWIEGINSNGKRLIQEAEGTVLIDELDAHLHPEWQLSLRGMLDKFFPKLQFIITTHSPHILASAQPGEVIRLDGSREKLIAKPTQKSYSGWSTDQILEDVMGVKNLESKLYNKLVHEALDSYSDRNAGKLELAIKELEKVAHPSDTIVQVLKIKQASLLLAHD